VDAALNLELRHRKINLADVVKALRSE
jgi:hypothetical protein